MSRSSKKGPFVEGRLLHRVEEMNDAGIHMAFVEMRSRLQDLVQKYGLFETLDRDHFYPSIETALTAIADETP